MSLILLKVECTPTLCECVAVVAVANLLDKITNTIISFIKYIYHGIFL